LFPYIRVGNQIPNHMFKEFKSLITWTNQLLVSILNYISFNYVNLINWVKIEQNWLNIILIYEQCQILFWIMKSKRYKMIKSKLGGCKKKNPNFIRPCHYIATWKEIKKRKKINKKSNSALYPAKITRTQVYFQIYICVS